MYTQDLSQGVLHSIGCGTNAFKLGQTQIFFRPKNEQFVDILLELNADATKKIAQEVSKKFYIRQRHSLWIIFRFLGTCKLSIIINFTFFR